MRRTAHNRGGIKSLFRRGFFTFRSVSYISTGHSLSNNVKGHCHLVYYWKHLLRSITTNFNKSIEYHAQFMIFWSSVTMTNSLHKYYTGQCSQSEVHLIHTLFQQLALLLSSNNCCHYTDRFVMSNSRMLYIWSTPQTTNNVQHCNHFAVYSRLTMCGLSLHNRKLLMTDDGGGK